MYWIVASDRQFKVPLVDIPTFKSLREAVVIGEEELDLQITPEHSEILDSMFTTVRRADRVVYEYALETLKQFLAITQPAVVEKVRTLVAKGVVHVAKASGKGIFRTGEKVSPQERECISHIAAELRLMDTPGAAEILNKL